MTDHRLQRLCRIAQLQRDCDMAQLNKLAQARTETQAKCDQLSRPQPLVSDPALFAVRQAHLAWTNAQRLCLNQALAQQTAQMLNQKSRTAKSFGRADALEKLVARLDQRRTHSP